jgi:phosphoglycerate-specific signal transduction histidine kinase
MDPVSIAGVAAASSQAAQDFLNIVQAYSQQSVQIAELANHVKSYVAILNALTDASNATWTSSGPNDELDSLTTKIQESLQRMNLTLYGLKELLDKYEKRADGKSIPKRNKKLQWALKGRNDLARLENDFNQEIRRLGLLLNLATMYVRWAF